MDDLDDLLHNRGRLFAPVPDLSDEEVKVLIAAERERYKEWLEKERT